MNNQTNDSPLPGFKDPADGLEAKVRALIAWPTDGVAIDECLKIIDRSMGNSVVLLREIDSLEVNPAGTMARIAELEAELAEFGQETDQTTIDNLRSRIAELEAEIVELNATILKSTTIALDLNLLNDGKIAELEAENENLNTALAQHCAGAYSKARGENSEHRQASEFWKGATAELESQNVRLKVENAKLKEQFDKSQDCLVEIYGSNV